MQAGPRLVWFSALTNRKRELQALTKQPDEDTRLETLLTIRELAPFIGNTNRQTLYAWILKGTFPPPDSDRCPQVGVAPVRNPTVAVGPYRRAQRPPGIAPGPGHDRRASAQLTSPRGRAIGVGMSAAKKRGPSCFIRAAFLQLDAPR